MEKKTVVKIKRNTFLNTLDDADRRTGVGATSRKQYRGEKTVLSMESEWENSLKQNDSRKRSKLHWEGGGTDWTRRTWVPLARKTKSGTEESESENDNRRFGKFPAELTDRPI